MVQLWYFGSSDKPQTRIEPLDCVFVVARWVIRDTVEQKLICKIKWTQAYFDLVTKFMPAHSLPPMSKPVLQKFANPYAFYSEFLWEY